MIGRGQSISPSSTFCSLRQKLGEIDVAAQGIPADAEGFPNFIVASELRRIMRQSLICPFSLPFFYLQPHPIGPGPFTRKHVLPLDIAVHQLRDRFLVARFPDDDRHILQVGQLAGTVAVLPGDKLIPALRVWPDKSGLADAPLLHRRGDLKSI